MLRNKITTVIVSARGIDLPLRTDKYASIDLCLYRRSHLGVWLQGLARRIDRRFTRSAG
jgi:hypothetical protein